MRKKLKNEIWMGLSYNLLAMVVLFNGLSKHSIGRIVIAIMFAIVGPFAQEWCRELLGKAEKEVSKYGQHDTSETEIQEQRLHA